MVRLVKDAESPAFPEAAEAEYADAGIDMASAVKAGVVRMLAEAWAAAGGPGYPLPAAVQYHDGDEYDLGERRWVG